MKTFISAVLATSVLSWDEAAWGGHKWGDDHELELNIGLKGNDFSNSWGSNKRNGLEFDLNKKDKNTFGGYGAGNWGNVGYQTGSFDDGFGNGFGKKDSKRTGYNSFDTGFSSGYGLGDYSNNSYGSNSYDAGFGNSGLGNYGGYGGYSRYSGDASYDSDGPRRSS